MYKLKHAILALSIVAAAGAAEANAQSKTRIFHADMSALDETKFTESTATGTADFVLDLDSKQVKWTVTYTGLSSEPVSIAIYGPAQPGANGQMMFSLTPKGLKSPIKGSSSVTEGQIQYFLYGWTYVNIVTKKFERGEVRGQLDIKQPEQ
jgi:hypothetical protein